MSDEDDAFVRAIREQPDDETTRLVYADWLDDRSDPRAEYLRTEAAWVALPLSDEQSSPLFRRVSQLAATLDLGWFVAVSRMGYLARAEWERVAHVWEPHPRDRTIEPVGEWRVAKQALDASFCRFVGPDVSARRFCVPADYLAFMTTIGGGWQQDNERDELYSASRLAQRIGIAGAAFAVPSDESLEIWVQIAADRNEDVYTQPSDYLMCCDLACARFGEIARVWDYPPWVSGGWSPRNSVGLTFFEFLRRPPFVPPPLGWNTIS